VKKDGVSFARAADSLEVGPKSFHRWHMELKGCMDLQVQESLAVNRDLYKNHRGPVGFLDDVKKKELIAFVSVWRDCGLPVTCLAVVRKIGQVKPDFLDWTLSGHLLVCCASLLQTILFIVL